MDMRRTRGTGDRFLVQEFGELARHELAGVVEVEMAGDAQWLWLADTAECVEIGYEGAHSLEGVAFLLKEIDLLESGMIVDQQEEVVGAMVRSFEWSGDVTVDETPNVRGLVRSPRMGHMRGICYFAVFAILGSAGGNALGDVGGVLSEVPQEVVSDMHAPMQHLELFVRRHGIKEARCLGAVDGCLKGASYPPQDVPSRAAKYGWRCAGTTVHLYKSSMRSKGRSSGCSPGMCKHCTSLNTASTFD